MVRYLFFIWYKAGSLLRPYFQRPSDLPCPDPCQVESQDKKEMVIGLLRVLVYFWRIIFAEILIPVSREGISRVLKF